MNYVRLLGPLSRSSSLSYSRQGRKLVTYVEKLMNAMKDDAQSEGHRDQVIETHCGRPKGHRLLQAA